MSELAGSRTLDNLRAALAAESLANRRHLYLAQQADVEGHPDLAELLRSVAEEETGHAFGHLEFLAEAGDAMVAGDAAANVRATAEEEAHDGDVVYPGYATTAREEGLEAVAAWFDALAAAERTHAERLRAGLDGLRSA